MTGMLSTGVSGLLAFQAALDTTSHNISNSTTPGYSRQTTNLMTAPMQLSGSSWLGTGVSVAAIQRSYNDLIAAQVRTSSSSMNQLDTYSGLAGQVNDLFGDSSTGLPASLQDFAAAFQGIANSPSSSAERQVLLSQAQTLVNQLKAYNSRLSELDTQVSAQLGSEARTISGLASSIAVLNQQISAATAQSTSPPNDMMDQRDQLLDELATHVNINVVKQPDNTVNVFIGNGQGLVVGATASTILTQADQYDPTRQGLAMQTGNGTPIDVTSSLSGGAIGGLLDFRSQLLDPAKSALGRIAVAVADAVNTQQNAGMDLHGNLGSDMFSVGDAQVMPNAKNAGTGAVTATRSDVGALTAADYMLTKTSSGWSLMRTDTGQAVTMTGSGTNASPFVADGLSIVVSGSASTGDRFLIRPTSNAVNMMSMDITDPGAVAAAAPIIATASSNNTGNATITQGVVTDSSDAQLRSTVTIQFMSATTYSIDGGATTQTYTSGQPIAGNGWEVTITGTPATGDTFVVKDNVGGTGDNRNALLMANLLDKKSLLGGAASINSVVGQWMADIGVKTNQAQTSLTTQTNLYHDNVSALQSVAGVNLDEEAANLVRYQQAYAAAAQLIATSNTLFDSLISAFR